MAVVCFVFANTGDEIIDIAGEQLMAPGYTPHDSEIANNHVLVKSSL